MQVHEAVAGKSNESFADGRGANAKLCRYILYAQWLASLKPS